MNPLLAILLASFAAFGQQAPASQQERPEDTPVFRVRSTLVQVDAVVADSKGRHVTDLGRDDFEVYQDGEPQRLMDVTYVRLAPESQTGQGEAAAVSPPAPSSQARREEVRRTIVLMVDDLGLSFESMAFVRHSLRKFVENDMQRGDLVAVCRSGLGSSALQQFTMDKRILLSIIGGLRWNPNGRSGVFEPIGAITDPRRNTMLAVGTLGAVDYMIEALREMPGRKSMVVFSDDMGLFRKAAAPQMHTRLDSNSLRLEENADIIEALRRLVDHANRAGTVIYTMHTLGLDPLQFGAHERVNLDQMSGAQVQAALRQSALDRRAAFHAAQQGLAYLAYETGGIPYENGNDLNWGLRRILEDQQGYYVLSYRPPESTFVEKHGARPFHRITVRVTRRGCRVRSRTGFFGETDEEARPKYGTPLDHLRAAMLSPFQSSGIRLRLTALYSEAAKKGAVVRNIFHIDARDIRFQLAEGGGLAARVSMLAVASDRDTRPLATVARVDNLNTVPRNLTSVLREGAIYTLDVPAPKPGGYHIRVAVRDETTGKVGSATQFLEIPDLKKVRFALTSIVLLDDGWEGAPNGLPGMTPAVRKFRRGGTLKYACLILDGKRKAGPEPAASIRIVRDGKSIYSGPAKVAGIEKGRRGIVGLLKLSDAMIPGEYFLQIAAGDAERWTDFEVLP